MNGQIDGWNWWMTTYLIINPRLRSFLAESTTWTLLLFLKSTCYEKSATYTKRKRTVQWTPMSPCPSFNNCQLQPVTFPLSAFRPVYLISFNYSSPLHARSRARAHTHTEWAKSFKTCFCCVKKIAWCKTENHNTAEKRAKENQS